LIKKIQVLFFIKEPKSEPEIKKFVKKFNVTFDMYSKIDVNGKRALPLYKYLKGKCKGRFPKDIEWNFAKFLVNKNGVPYKRYSPNTSPSDIEKDILYLLKFN
jgi:glutathione peroxidase-family protein